MPWFYDLPWDEQTGRHHLVFNNQQYDFLAGIAWDPDAQDYAMWAMDGVNTWEELARLLSECGPSVTADALRRYLDVARTELPEKDAARSHG